LSETAVQRQHRFVTIRIKHLVLEKFSPLRRYRFGARPSIRPEPRMRNIPYPPGGSRRVAGSNTRIFLEPSQFFYYESDHPYHETYADSYGIRAAYRTLRKRIDPSIDQPILAITLSAGKQ
jgi:hypothetical protein